MTIAVAIIQVRDLVPFTTWIAAILRPVWLGLAGALSHRAGQASR